MKHRKEIDGLRAVAVLPVILFHAGFSTFSGGYVGVDIFFVISGYLITGIILRELQEERFSLLLFYERRARRILPALFLVMIFCMPLAWAWMLPHQLKDFSQSIAAVSLFSSNVLFWLESGYFAAVSDQKPLLHTWSLAVEEQYYLIFPLYIILIWKSHRKYIIHSFILFAILSFLLCEWGWRYYPAANFYLAPFRAWELLAGAICAYLQGRITLRKNSLISLLGIAIILFAIFTFDEETPMPSVYGLLPVGGTVLILIFGSSGTWTANILTLRPLVAIGLISYSAYLWHQPLFAFARILSTLPPGPGIMLTFSFVSLILGGISWKFVEQPFRRQSLSPLTWHSTVFEVSGIAIFTMLILGSIGHLYSNQISGWLLFASDSQKITYKITEKENNRSEPIIDNGSCVFNVQNISKVVLHRILNCSDEYGPGIAVIGDSHAIDLMSTLSSSTEIPFLIGVTRGACRPHTPKEFCQYSAFLDFVRSNEHVFETIIFEQAGFYLLENEFGEEGRRDFFDKYKLDEMIPSYSVSKKNIERNIYYLMNMPNDIKIVWFGPRVEPHISQKILLNRGCDAEYKLRPNQKAVFENLDGYISEKLSRTRIEYVSQIQLMKLDMGHDFMNCDTLYWSDGDHLSTTGEQYFGDRYAEKLIHLATSDER